MAILADSHQDALPPKRSPVEGRRRPLLRAFLVFVVLGLACFAGVALRDALQSPVQHIRSELRAASSDLQSSAAVPRERVLAELRRDFSDHDVTINASSWPNVAITFHHLDANTCREASASIDRLEGLVVIALDPRPDASDCRAANDLTWRIMP
jgi:hypothetical protein